MTTNRETIFRQAHEAIVYGSVKTDKLPAIFTSCKKPEAQRFIADNPAYGLIHSSEAGKALEQLDLFKHMSGKLAYLHWFYLSARFVVENDFPPEVIFVADFANPSSTAFGIEIPVIYATKPDVTHITNPLNGVTIPRADWHAQRLCRPYVAALLNHYANGPRYDLTDEESLLIRKFNEAGKVIPTTEDPLDFSTEWGLQTMLVGYLGAYGKFPYEMPTQRLRAS